MKRYLKGCTHISPVSLFYYRKDKMKAFFICIIFACFICCFISEARMQASVLGKGNNGQPQWPERSGLCTQGVCDEWLKADKTCKSHVCLKRGIRQEEMGPFWANRGKKNPTYKSDALYVQEPHWILVRRDDESGLSNYDPFFITRGKKFFSINDDEGDDAMKNYVKDLSVRDRRDYGSDESPFFAARGKKINEVLNE